MKKLFITWGLAAAALTLFSCAKQEAIVNDAQPAQAGVPFELVAGVDTKTTTTDASTINWVANDALNVFVAEHNSAFGNNKQFTTADGTSTFSGVLESALDGAKTYDWKVFYPYNEDILTVSTHNGTKGYLTLGSKTNATQTQAGNNNKAHLAGAHMPLYGIGNGVAGDGTPNISLSQVMSVVAVEVTNKTDSPLVVSSVDFTAPAGTLITGTFFLDFSGSTPVFESSGTSYTSNVAKLTVTDGVAIAKNGSADFYIAVKPFAAAVNDEIKVSVNGEEQTIKLDAATTFAPGKIKTVKYQKTVEEIASATFDGKNQTYTTGWSTTGTGKGRTDCIVIGKDENITSPAFNLFNYSSVTIKIKARRYGTLSGGKATIDVSIGGISVGTKDATTTSATTELEEITFTPTASMTSAALVFTCKNATSAGSSHGAGINSIAITGVRK